MDDLIALRALGALITYPRPELISALSEIGAMLARSRLLPRAERERLDALISEMRAADPIDLEGRYVELFDRGRRTSLHVFEHVHGESRDRGAAMVELNLIYANAGYRLAAKELPDYLPVVLEYLSCRTLVEARAMLCDCAHVLRSIGETLMQRGSSYAAVFAALLAVAQEPGLDGSKAREAPAQEALDEDWAEIPAFAPADSGPTAETAQVAPIRFVSRKPLP
ncbi:MAG TPA: nitrate reductase molybdenum cofactor assembly chaperone [Casimicrobiaceae bacterium]|nr:nitrate reductase molybdenum cofactor assembly chaperone [Casimicrobiaceae bacterium]